jgi:hypothetical protein
MDGESVAALVWFKKGFGVQPLFNLFVNANDVAVICKPSLVSFWRNFYCWNFALGGDFTFLSTARAK